MKRRINMEEFKRNIISDKFRYYFQMLILSFVLGTTSLGMGIMNIFTHKVLLMWAMLGFALICAINVLIMFFSRKIHHLNYAIFEVSICVLFTYFLLTGGTAGFSPHWILVLPACGMMFIGRRRGFIVSLIMLVIVAGILWSPLKTIIPYQDYSPEFCMRFPVVYIVFFAIGYIFELLRGLTYNLLLETQQKLEESANTDALTQIGNRRWFYNHISTHYKNALARHDGVFVMFDIDNFKNVNDVYGHATGDDTLVSVVNAVIGAVRQSDLLCRWGGEEFIMYLTDCNAYTAESTCDRIRNTVANNDITAKNGTVFRVTVSIGAVIIPKGQIIKPDKIFDIVDKQLYIAKNSGKNRVELVSADDIQSY